MTLFTEEGGKVSFGRVFGVAAASSVLAGWWLVLLSSSPDGWQFTLPELTNEILGIAMLPYGIGKVAGAWVKAKNGNNGVTTAMNTGA